MDAVAYARAQTSDVDPSDYTVSDAEYQSFVLAVELDIARFVNRGPLYVGNFGAQPPTSPLVTINGVGRYSCSAGNGFDPAIIDVLDVLYMAPGDFNAGNDLAWLALSPASTEIWHAYETEVFAEPASRIIRDSYLNEIRHYGRGKFSLAVGNDGVPAIDLYPVPTQSGLPVMVAYKARHTVTDISNTDNSGSVQYTTIPEIMAVHFARLLLAEVRFMKADALCGRKMTRAGMAQKQTDPTAMRNQAMYDKEFTYAVLGQNTPVVRVTN